MPREASLETIEIRRVAVAQILALRRAVLRPNGPIEHAHFDGDDAVTTIHMAAFAKRKVVGCASWMLNVFAGEAAFQLRGMAVDPILHGSGIGRRLLRDSEGVLWESCIKLRWCNARMSAVGFYEHQGWQVVSPVFDIPQVGPHCKMTYRV